VGARTSLADVRELGLPVYDPDMPLDEYPPALSRLLDAVRAADAYILCSPTYHGTISGAVKNVLDALDLLAGDDPPYLGGKVVGLTALGGAGAIHVIDALHHAARALNGLSAPTVVTVPGSALHPETGELHDAAVEARLETMARQMIELTHKLHTETWPEEAWASGAG
jgi:FMN reductase